MSERTSERSPEPASEPAPGRPAGTGTAGPAGASALPVDADTEQALLTADEIAELLRKDEVLTHMPLTDRRAAQKKAEKAEGTVP